MVSLLSLDRARSLALPILAAAAAGSTATAQLPVERLLVTWAASGNDSTLTEYDPDGVQLSQIGSTAWTSFTACAIAPNGDRVFTRGLTVEVHAPDGALLREFLLGSAYWGAADIDVFSDGTLAVCAKNLGVQLYDLDGAYLATLAPPGMESPFGCRVTPGDLIWVVDRLDSVPGQSRVFQLDRQGTVAHVFDVPFQASDVVQAQNGDVWLSDMIAGRVARYTPDGTPVNAFDVQIDSSLRTLWSLAIDSDGAIIASGHYDSFVRYYSPTGALLREFDTDEEGNSLFMVVSEGGGPGTAYCFGDGTGNPCSCGNLGGPGEGCANSSGAGAVLAAAGSRIVALDSLRFDAVGLLPNQPALLFVGNNATGGGNGLLFGDGLRCAGGGVVRLGVRTPDAAGHASWGPSLAAIGGWAAGDVRRFQAWYRDPSPSAPCGSGFNLSNGIEVAFQ